MKKRILTTAILLTGLLSASTYHYTFKISDTSLFNNSQTFSNEPIMQESTPQERTGVPSTGVILASDGGVDWYGEVSAANLISGNNLANMVGLTAGSAQYSESPWIHVNLDGKELFIAKMPFRYNISRDDLENQNLLFGNRIVNINNQNYIIRVLKGSINSTVNVSDSGYDTVGTHGSEWNRIMYRLTQGIDNKNSENPFIHLAYYSNSDLNFIEDANGAWSLTQEIESVNQVMRGYESVSRLGRYSKSTPHIRVGWRPVLEKIN